MPRNEKKNLTSEKKVKIVLDKKTTRKSITKIAREMDRSPATVSTIKYESLTDEEKAVAAQIRALPYKTAFRLDQTVDAIGETVELARAEPSVKNLAGLTTAAKTLHEMHLRSTNQATQIIEHRPTDLDLARMTLQKLLRSPHFDPETAISATAEAYDIDPKLLTD